MPMLKTRSMGSPEAMTSRAAPTTKADNRSPDLRLAPRRMPCVMADTLPSDCTLNTASDMLRPTQMSLSEPPLAPAAAAALRAAALLPPPVQRRQATAASVEV
jgi:hypothetical protein